MKTIREGGNGFTCMVMGRDSMCNDANSMEFIHALMKKEPPPDKVGISYMLAGDEGASNTDPYAKGKTADNHWLITGPHIMVFGPPSKTLWIHRSEGPGSDETLHDVGWHVLRARNDSRWNQITSPDLILDLSPHV